MSIKKQIGIIVFYKRINDFSFLVGLVLEESIYKKCIIKIKEKIFIGQQLFGYFYEFNNMEFFKVESVENFLGLYFWNDEKKMKNFIELIDVFKEVPLNLFIENLYETFIDSVKNIAKNNDFEVNFQNNFKNWLKKTL